MNSRRYRSDQLPYHISNSGIQNLGKFSNPVAVSNKKKLRYEDAPSTYMVINFDEPFVESLPSDMPPILRVDEQRIKSTVSKFRSSSPGKEGLAKKTPAMSSSFLLPKVVPESGAERIMFRRNDVGTQTDINMNRHNFEHLSNYQKWTSEVVEPFIKELRKEVKAKRPEDVPSYIIRYCQAMMKNEPPPDTVDPDNPPS